MSFIKIPLSLGWLINNLALNIHLIVLTASFNLAKSKRGLWGEENNLAMEKDSPVWNQDWLFIDEIK